MPGIFCGKKLKTMTLTATIVSVMSFVMLQADFVIIGQLINQQAVGAVTLISPFKDFASFIAILVSGGSVSCILMENGKLHKNRANAYFTNGLVAAAAAGILLLVIGIPLKDILLDTVGRYTATYGYADAYYRYYLFAVLLYPLFVFLQQIVYIDGNESLFIGSYLLQILCNITFSVKLSHSMGISGIALGSVIGLAAGLLILLLHFRPGHSSLRLNFRTSRSKRINLYANGFTSASPMLFSAIFTMLLNRFFVSQYGDVSLSILTVASNGLRLTSIMSGVCFAAPPFIALYYCENSINQLNSVLRYFRRVLLMLALILTVLVMIFAPSIARLFGITNSAFAVKATAALRIIPIGFFGRALIMLAFSFHSTSGSLPYACVLSLLQELVAPALLVLPLAMLYGMRGMWIGFMLSPYLVIVLLSVNIKLGDQTFRDMFFLQSSESPDVYTYELTLSQDNVSKLLNDIDALLDDKKISSKTKNSIVLLIEEIYMLTMEYNPGKTLSAECTLNFGDDILLVLKDNGVCFDVTDPDLPVSSLRGFIVGCIMEHQARKVSFTTLCCNRNAFRFTLEKTNTNTADAT